MSQVLTHVFKMLCTLQQGALNYMRVQQPPHAMRPHMCSKEMICLSQEVIHQICGCGLHIQTA